MSRGGVKQQREIPGDPVFNSQTVQRFINKLMLGGKKSISESIFYGAMQKIEEDSGRNPLEVFTVAMKNVTPAVEVRSRRVGGSTYQVPTEVRPDRRATMAMRWLINSARSRNEKTMIEKLAAEFLDASRNNGSAIKKKEDTHRMADANKAFSHYRW